MEVIQLIPSFRLPASSMQEFLPFQDELLPTLAVNTVNCILESDDSSTIYCALINLVPEFYNQSKSFAVEKG